MYKCLTQPVLSNICKCYSYASIVLPITYLYLLDFDSVQKVHSYEEWLEIATQSQMEGKLKE